MNPIHHIVINLEKMNQCPISAAMEYIGKKWMIEIIRDFFMGKTHFNQFLESNKKPGGSLSSKVLTDRLNELLEHGIIEKEVKKKFPIDIEYSLTERGKTLNKVLYELAVFSCGCGEKEGIYTHSCTAGALKFLKKAFRIENK